MEKKEMQVMQVTKERNGELLYPISLVHGREITYGRSYGQKLVVECEVYVHVEGECTAYVGDQVIRPGRGTVLVYHPGERHTHFVTGLKPFERYVLLFRYDEISNLWDGADRAMLRMFSEREMFEKNSIQLPAAETGRLISLLQKAISYADSSAPDREAQFYATALKVLALVSDGFTKMEDRQNKGSCSPIVNMALEIVEEQFVELQSVEQLALQLHISNSYLARIFKKQVGTSVYEYIQNMKLANAAKLLAAGKTVTEACFDSGFNNYSYFIQLFRRKYGVTPRRYQKTLEL